MKRKELEAQSAAAAAKVRRRVLFDLSVAREEPTRTYEPNEQELQAALEQVRAPLRTQEL
jgi:hypothetical protein